MRLKHRHKTEVELDITSFMNLMIILVPVLLMSMVFSHVSILELNLPGLSDNSSGDLKNQQIEVVLRQQHIDINYPAGIRVKRINKKEKQQDFELLSKTLQEIKRQLKEKGIDKRDAVILSEANTDYQTLVTTMDTVRSFRAVVAASAVDAELFPAISLGDAPVNNSSSGTPAEVQKNTASATLGAK